MDTCSLSLTVAATGPDLLLRVVLDSNLIYQDSPTIHPLQLTHDLDDSIRQDHVLSFELAGKLPEHTKLDTSGEIISDRSIIISDVSMYDVKLGQKFTNASLYYHDHNGSTDPIVQPFYGVMGCNGRVEMRFSTPAYMWMLENI